MRGVSIRAVTGILSVLLAVKSPCLAHQATPPDATTQQQPNEQPPNPAPPPPDQPSPAPTPEIAAPQPVPTTLEHGLIALLGKDVRSNNGAETVGKITDVLVDGGGSVTAVVIDVGGFLGVGSRKIAVDWKLLHIDSANAKNPITVAEDRAALQAAPSYAESTETKQVVTPPDAPPPATGDAPELPPVTEAPIQGPARSDGEPADTKPPDGPR